MTYGIRHTKGFSCAPGSGFFARCKECKRLLIFGQTCTCGHKSGQSVKTEKSVPLFDTWARREAAPRSVCLSCSFEYTRGTEHVCRS